MRGSIIQRKDKDGNPIGNYRIKVCLGKNAQTGKYDAYYETLPDGTSKPDAQKRLRQLLTELDKGIFVKPGKLTVGEYLRVWLKDNALPNMAPRTYEGYEFQINKYAIPTLGKIPLTELKPAHIQHLCSQKQTAGLHRTAQYIYNSLNKALSVAVKTGIIARNPCDAVESPRVPRHEMKTMSESDVHIFLELARNSDYYPIFYTMLFTGIRRSEVLALKWGDCDLDLCQISVNRTLHVLRYGTLKGQVIFKAPKTQKSRRMIALTPSTSIVLKEHKEKQNKLRQSLGMNLVSDDDLVFCQYDGKPLQPDTISHAWLKMARRTGLKGIRLHDARHTHASLMLKQGIHPKIVQERLGHMSIETTLDTYSHVAPGLQQAAAKRFDDVLMPSKDLETVQK